MTNLPTTESISNGEVVSEKANNTKTTFFRLPQSQKRCDLGNLPLQIFSLSEIVLQDLDIPVS
jgi:hypothetical protein